MNWDGFLRHIVVPLILNRSNSNVKSNRPRRASIPRNLTQTTVISHINLISSSDDFKKNPPVTPTTTSSPDLSFNESFRKYGKLLKKLNQRDQQEEYRKKQYGSLVDWSIVESIEDEQNFEIPKLKPNARDERQTISEPWSVVKEMQHLRTEPLFVSTTRINLVHI